MTTAETSTSTATPPFSGVIRDATAGAHDDAAASRFMGALFSKQLAQPAYVEMIAQHWFAYRALDGVGERFADHPVAGAFVDPVLVRVDALAADLQHLLGDDWAEKIAPSPATAEYCERIEEVAALSPERFVAHHYTRYMGDLSGGQMIGRIACDVYDLAPDAGAAFYDFDIDDVAAYKDGYRQRLDDAPWDEREREAVLEEVAVAYRLNTAVFADLDRLDGVPS